MAIAVCRPISASAAFPPAAWAIEPPAAADSAAPPIVPPSELTAAPASPAASAVAESWPMPPPDPERLPHHVRPLEGRAGEWRPPVRERQRGHVVRCPEPLAVLQVHGHDRQIERLDQPVT